MQIIRALGIDPGIANCGFGVVVHAKQKYYFISSETVKTSPKEKAGQRYLTIYERLTELVAKHDVSLIAIESVYFNENRTSNQTTAGVIALVEMCAAEMELPIYQVRPQAVKTAVGCYQNASKDDVKKMIAKLLKVEIANTHYSIRTFSCTSGESHTQHLPHFYAAMDNPSAPDTA